MNYFILRLLLVTASVLANGCVAVPYHSYKVYEGHEITTQSLAWVTPGETTRAQILERFGEPDISLNAQHVIAYEWSGQYGRVVLITMNGSGESTPIKMRCAMVMEFDANDAVKDYSIIARPSTIKPYDYHPASSIQSSDDWRIIIKEWHERQDRDREHKASDDNGCYTQHEHNPYQ